MRYGAHRRAEERLQVAKGIEDVAYALQTLALAIHQEEAELSEFCERLETFSPGLTLQEAKQQAQDLMDEAPYL